MDSNSKSRWQVRGAAILIFVLGCIAGALSLNLYRMRQISGSHEWRRARFEQMVERLNLSDEQKNEVGKIMSETRARLIEIRNESQPRVTEIRSEARTRMQAVLTPEQWQQLQTMMQSGRGRHGRERTGSQ